MAGLGVEKLEKLMPEIVATASKVDIAPHVRDGYIMMFNYLPITFGDKFTPYVGPIIPCILKVGTHHHAEAKKKKMSEQAVGAFLELLGLPAAGASHWFFKEPYFHLV